MEHVTATSEEFSAQCACGKRYRVAAEKRGRKLKCKACGATFLAEPAPKPVGKHEPPHPAEEALAQAVEPAKEQAHAHEPAPEPIREEPPAAAQETPAPAVHAQASVAPAAPLAPQPNGGAAEAVDPSLLLRDVSRGNLVTLLVIAFVVHVVVIGISSVSHITLCCKYSTFWPKPFMKREREEEEKRKLEAKQAEQEKALAEQRKTETGKESKAEPSGKVEEKNESKAGKPKSKMEKALEEKSSERPKEPTIQLESPNSLE